MKKLFYIKCLQVFLLLITWNGVAQQNKQHQISVPVEKNMSWWTGVIKHGEMMPIQNGYKANLNQNYGNQVQPMLLSNQGHVIWSEKPFEISMENGILNVISPDSSLTYIKAGKTLKEGFKFASENHFSPSGKLPDRLLFSEPQYNTWIELMYDQNQEDILEYARQIIANGFPPGVLMIDDNWQEDYGKWNFHEGRFPNPKMMVDSLHAMGFKVMLWVCPFVSPDCDVFRKLREEDILLEDKAGNPALIEWWNGYSSLIDLSKKEGNQWFENQLNNLKDTYGIDGFKLDAGDFGTYEDCYSGGVKVSPQEHSELYAKIGLGNPLNEYRAMWKMAGQPIVNRLSDKRHNWEDLQKLVPGILVQGIMGYSFSCPDMIGGGEFVSFLSAETIDQELIVRSAQCHALMPMMQFSVAPWRILDKEHFEAVKKAVEIRSKYVPLIMEFAEQSAISGEPIVRSMEYVFPHQGYELVKNQFMLGDDILVAPVLEKGAQNRKVILPKGKWIDELGVVYRGGKSVDIKVSLERLPYFKRLK
ncbi:glycoside hydrolase [Maribacter sp. ANRC-HE7]|uniref:Glycoside hydrolase n=1 Tax=Maribacter aquimaris TaxID=2737171 RepID=A0ABR7UY96_9FLAO|nr:glycoside hydrolase family 31 protein [Maribacter aquimaris]MBD0777567.1 glycoside hydrolase [Maribacter aquimaris]